MRSKDTSYKKLRRYRHFSNLSDGALETISRKLELINLPAGTKIIREKSPADSFYLVNKGEVEVHKRTKWGQSAIIGVVGKSEGFGEIALLTCSPRCCSVTAKTDVELYKLKKSDFERIVHLDATFSNLLESKAHCFTEYDKMKMLQPFALLEPEKMLAVVGQMNEENFSPGETIITQGEKGSLYYIIKSGRASVIKQEKDSEPRQVVELGPGEGFGEEALIREKPRNATVKAIDEITVLTLNKADFDKILGESFIEWYYSEDIPKDKMDQYVFIDARIPPEYEVEHIEGAVNIPIEEMRQRYGELDPSQEYYAYCISDSRGAAAAFLLKSQGFNVKAIRGGLSAWDGPVHQGSDGIDHPSGN